MLQIDIHGGWRVALYRDDGTLDTNFDVKVWKEKDKIDILEEIRGYLSRKFHESSATAEKEAREFTKSLSRQAAKIKYLEKESDIREGRLRQVEDELQVASASLEEHERMDYGQLAQKLGDKPAELLPHLLKRMLQERIAAVTLLKAVQR